MSQNDTEDDGGLSANAAPPSATKQQGLFGSSGIQLTDEESSSPAAIKFLRHINVNQEIEVTELRSFKDQFYEKRQECEVLKSERNAVQKELEKKKEMENVQKAMITCGSLLLGAMKLLDSASWYALTLLCIIASLLIVGGIFPVFRIGPSK
ncbi:hypothetical protein [Xanthomonas axonopodis]